MQNDFNVIKLMKDKNRTTWVISSPVKRAVILRFSWPSEFAFDKIYFSLLTNESRPSILEGKRREHSFY